MLDATDYAELNGDAAWADVFAGAERLEREHEGVPEAHEAIALHREGSEVVMSYSDWNLLRATAQICKWYPRISWYDVAANEALELAEGFTQLRARLEERGLNRLPLPDPAVIEFLRGGAFTASYIG